MNTNSLFTSVFPCRFTILMLWVHFVGLKGLDFVIAEARRYGIKLILSLANNYDSFGGKKQYVNWARNQGQYLSSDDDFFRHPVVKGYFKNHIKVAIPLAPYCFYFMNFMSTIAIDFCKFVF